MPEAGDSRITILSVGLRAQANFSAQTFKPASEARAGQRAALSVQSAAAAMQHLEQLSASVASSPLSVQQRTCLIFAKQIEIFQVKAWLATFKAGNANLKLLGDRRFEKEKENSSIDLQRAFTSASVDRSSISSASVAAGLFPNLSCLVSLNF